MNLSPVLIRIFAAFAIALGAGGLSALLARTHRQLCAFISLGAGTLLGVAACGIAPECLEALRWWQFLLGAASGYLLFAIVSRYIFHVCPACAASHFDDATTHHLAEFGLAMMIALAIHCTVDGLALAVGHEESEAVDWSVTFAICVHKFPEGLALGALLLGGGFQRKRMLWLVAAVESTTILGGLLGWFVLGNVSSFWLALALANAGGGFFYLAIHAMLGEIFRHHKTLVLANFAAGFSVIAALILWFHLKA
ncbi:putative Zinc/iron permease [Verrucomicrobia bacterium]|nr:putative Zinc/iron permease [Verrucomicrobiota bacterium]